MNIVVSGVGVVTSMGIGVNQNICAMRDCITGISKTPSILKTANMLPVGELCLTNESLHKKLDIPFDASLSRTALLGILAVREALEDAKVDKSRRIGLVSSTSVAGMDMTEQFFVEFMKDRSKGRLRDVRMHDCAAVTDAIVRYCGINSYSTTISTACSSSANAIIQGCKLIKNNILDYVVVGGCDSLSLFTLNGFNSLMILDGDICKPFDNKRSGLNLGEGAGYIVLQREEHAVDMYCYLKGYANANDAYHQTASSPNGYGAYLAMSQAIKSAHIRPEDIDYINVHGTGTQNNDYSEGVAMVELFGKNLPAFSSTKGFTGHTLAAAGGIEAVYSSLSVKFGYVYPNLNFSEPIDGLGLVPEKRFMINEKLDYVLSNSFGFGGNCTSIILGK